MFLPNDKMFVEVLNIEGLFENIYSLNILIAGPSRLAAFLSSLRIGFKHIALNKKSSEILDLYTTMKKGIGEFNEVLLKVQENLAAAQKRIDDAGKKVNGFKDKLETIEIHVCDGPLVCAENSATDNVPGDLVADSRP